MYIVNATNEVRNYFARNDQDDSAVGSFDSNNGASEYRYHQVPISDTDNSNMLPYLDSCLEFIHDGRTQGYHVLVHCQQGVSRSASIIIAYLMKYLGLTLTDAYVHLKSQRHDVKPKRNFLHQLMEFQKQFTIHNKLDSDIFKAALKQLKHCGISSNTSEELISDKEDKSDEASSSISYPPKISSPPSSTFSSEQNCSTQNELSSISAEENCKLTSQKRKLVGSSPPNKRLTTNSDSNRDIFANPKKSLESHFQIAGTTSNKYDDIVLQQKTALSKPQSNVVESINDKNISSSQAPPRLVGPVLPPHLMRNS